MSEPTVTRSTATGEESGSDVTDQTYPSLWRWQTFLSLGFTVALLGFLAAQLDLNEVRADLAACDKRLVLLGLLAHYSTYYLKGLRWKLSLGDLTRQVSTGAFTTIMIFFNAVDNLVPGKLADLYAAHLARINFRIRRSAALGSLVFQRLLDAWVVLALAGLSSWVLFSDHLPSGVVWVLGGGLLIALAITGAMGFMMLIRRSTPRWVPKPVTEMIQAFNETLWPARRDWGPVLLLTLLVWTMETLWMFCLLSAFDVSVSLPQLVFLTQIPLLASAFPLTPSGAGAVEITLFGCLTLCAVPASLAASITVLNRLIDYWLHIALGALIWLLRKPLKLYTLRERPALETGSA